MVVVVVPGFKRSGSKVVVDVVGSIPGTIVVVVVVGIPGTGAGVVVVVDVVVVRG